MMKIISAQKSDLASIMRVVQSAQIYLAELGIDQWQDGYPNQEVVLKDINNNESYLVINDRNECIGTTMFSLRPEPTYTLIEERDWLTKEGMQYGVIHRMAVDDQFRSSGFSRFVFDHFENLLIEKEIKSMRIDTHEDNQMMQGLLKKRGYHYCGIIYLESGSKRLAFEKLLDF